MKKRLIALALVFLGCAGNTDCEGTPPSTRTESDVVERQQQVYVNNQPPPFFDFSLERHLYSELYKARNNAVATYTYVRNQYTGKILSFCPSIGFPISAATQLTNPQRVLRYGENGVGTLPQPEPNGLWSPAESRGTYVMCLNKDGQVVPRYYEEDVEAYLMPMHEVNGQLVEVEGSTPSLTIDPKRPVQR